MSYYTINELFPGAHTREWITSASPGWSAFNPSISFSKKEGYKAIIRSSNYIMDEQGYYHMTSPDGVIRTQNHLATLDSELNIVNLDLLSAGEWGEVQFPLVVGLEDARLHWRDNSWHVYGTLRQHRYDGLCEIATARIEHDKLLDCRVIENPEPGRHQKNWMALSGTPHFIYTVSPPVVYRHEAALDQDYEKETPNLDLRGSSQAIYLPFLGGWIAVTHEVDWSTGYRRYFHRFVAFDVDGYVAAMTEPFSMLRPAIEFAAGLVEHGDDYVVSFGLEDYRAFLAYFPKREVLAGLIGV